jgi:hypothetical protein
MVPLDGAPNIEMDLFQKKLIETVYCELGWALEYLGLDHRPKRLSSAVLNLLAAPEMIVLYTSGESVPIN